MRLRSLSLLLAALWVVSPLHARDGVPDAEFGPDGIVVIPQPAGAHAVPVTSAIDPKGRILIAGRYGDGQAPWVKGFIARLLPDGSVDTSFANAGWFVMPQIPGLGFDEYPKTVFAAIALTDDRIYVGGYPTNQRTCALVLALDDNGALQSDFGTNGSGAICGPSGLPPGVFSNADRHAPLIGLVVTNNQVIISVLKMFFVDYVPQSHWVYALNPDGSPSSGFGANGLVSYDDGFVSGGLALDSMGRLLIPGLRDGKFEFQRRLLPSGNLDPSFGLDGTATLAAPAFGYNQTQMQTWSMLDDRPAANFSVTRNVDGTGGSLNYGIFRVRNDGTVDGNLATNPFDNHPGFVAYPTLVPAEEIASTAGARDRFDRVLIAGPELVRLTSDGNLDASFGSSGYVDLPQPTYVPLTSNGGVEQTVSVDAAGNVYVVAKDYSYDFASAVLRVQKIVGDTLFDGTFDG